MSAPSEARADEIIQLGDECWAIVTERVGKGTKRNVLNTARVVFDGNHENGDAYVRVLQCSPGHGVLVGQTYAVRVCDLFPDTKSGRRRFAEAVSLYWRKDR